MSTQDTLQFKKELSYSAWNFLKNKSSSLSELSEESDPCAAFLVESDPNKARILLGLSCCAFSVLVGPYSY